MDTLIWLIAVLPGAALGAFVLSVIMAIIGYFMTGNGAYWERLGEIAVVGAGCSLATALATAPFFHNPLHPGKIWWAATIVLAFVGLLIAEPACHKDHTPEWKQAWRRVVLSAAAFAAAGTLTISGVCAVLVEVLKIKSP